MAPDPKTPEAEGGSASNLPLLSVVVPCYDEEAVINLTHARLSGVLDGLSGVAWEILYVDDGSGDSTPDLLREFARVDSRVRVLALSRNFGHQTALTAGLTEATGDIVAIIDADLQDPPEIIAEMLERWRAGADVAYGRRIARAGETAFKRWTSAAFYRVLAFFSDAPIRIDSGDFQLMDRSVVDALAAMPERDRFVRGLVAWAGFRQEAVPYRRDPRAAGETKYPLRKMLRFAASGVVSFSLAPLRLATWLGFLVSGAAGAGIVYALALRLFGDSWVTGWTLLFISILFLGGIQLTMIGVVGEYVGRIYGEAKRRPLYLVKERIGYSPPAEGRRPPKGGCGERARRSGESQDRLRPSVRRNNGRHAPSRNGAISP